MPDESLTDHTIAITGAGGFIGSHLTRASLREGYTVRALVRYHATGSIGHLEEVIREGKRKNEKWVIEDRLTIVHGDIQDERCVRELVSGCDQVFHLAALIGIPYSYRAPSSYVQVNTIGTLNVLEACRDECPERLLITSTSEVYGSAREVPMREQHLLQAQSPYAASKIASDKLTESYVLSYNQPIVTLRPFNAYGPRQTARAVIPTILSQVLSDRCNVVHLGNLEAVRDLTYVSDTVAAYIAASKAPLKHVSGRLYNIGSGIGHSVGEIAKLAMKVLEIEKPIVSDPDRHRPEKSEVQKLVGDSSRIQREIGWTPTIDLEEGLLRTAKWIKGNLDLFQPEHYRV